jgi:hypothetical protein
MSHEEQGENEATGRKKRAARLHQQIERLKKAPPGTAPPVEEEGESKRKESPREFVERKRRESLEEED